MSEIFSNEGQWFWAAIGTMAVVVTLFAVYRQLRIQNSTHTISSIELLIDSWNSENFLKLRKHVCESMLENPEYFGNDSEELMEIFERIGVYVKIGALPDEVVWEIFSWYVEHYYELTRSNLRNVRKLHGDNLLYENFEKLAVKLNTISRAKGLAPILVKNSDQARAFLEAEIATVNTLLGVETR